MAQNTVIARSAAGSGQPAALSAPMLSVILQSDAAGVRTAISAQPLDGTLTALAAFNTNGLVCQTGADTFAGRTITGTTNRISVANGDGVSGAPTLDLASTYAGQASIATVGTITAGVWQGTAVGVAYGGTGLSLCELGDVLYGSASNTYARASGAKSVLPQFLRSVGNGTSNTGTGFALVPGQLLAVSRVATDEATSSTTPADLATAQSVTFQLPTAATVWIRASAVFYSATVSVRHQIAIDVDGTDSEIAFSDCAAANHCATVAGAIAVALGSGSHTLKLQFSVNTGTGRFLRRCLDVVVAP